jgi:hypothetical protein
MRLSDIKEVYTIVKQNLLFQDWTVKQNVNDFIEFIEAQEDVKKEWCRASRQPFPYCLDDLHLEYMGYEGFIEEPEEERAPLNFINDNKYLNDWYYKNLF